MAQGDPVDDVTFSNMLDRWNGILDFPEELLSDEDISPNELQPLSENIVLVADLAQRARTEAEENLNRAQKLLDALGPAPADSDPPETQKLMEKRADLVEQVTLYDGRVKQTKVILTRARDLLARIGHVEVSIITNVLTKRMGSPLSADVITAGVHQLPDRVSGLWDSLGKWWQNSHFDHGLRALLQAVVTVLACVVGILFVRHWLVSRYGMVRGDEEPTLARRFVAIVVETLSNVILPTAVIGGAAIFVASNAQFPNSIERGFNLLVLTIIQFILITGLAKASLSSHQPQWRIIPFTDDSAANLENSIFLFAAVLAFVNVCIILVNPTHADFGMISIVDFDSSTEAMVLVCMLGLFAASAAAWNVLRPNNWRFQGPGDSEQKQDDDGTSDPGSAPDHAAPLNVRILFNVAKGLLIFGSIAYVVGYLNLGIYVASRTVLTLCYIAIALLLHGLVLEGLKQATSEDNSVGRKVRDRFALQSTGVSRLVFWVVFLFDIILISVAFVLLLNLWGVPWTEIRPVFSSLIYGTEIGGHTFSLTGLAIALGAFAVIMLAFRLLQGFLSNRILVQTRLDVGVRDAVTAGVGYVGVVVAVLVALSLMGLKFGDIALIFSALSIGIGFGLQHIVNNFISGLVLLVQRPIKSGDWIVVGPNQGYVKRVNVISTEITTFDNATVIIPNSQLMTTDVTNWTHRGRLGRVKVPVGVSYSADPERVSEILLQCARANESVLSRPAPSVVFVNFGESSLDFEVRVFIREIDYTLNVASELRQAIKKALDEAGIVIPFPQRDVHINPRDNPPEASAAAP